MSISPLPGDASNDPTEDQTGRFVRQPNGRVRPLSPHLQIWRWHVTMLTSILHRVTGVGLYLAGLIVAAWAVSLADDGGGVVVLERAGEGWRGRLTVDGRSRPVTITRPD